MNRGVEFGLMVYFGSGSMAFRALFMITYLVFVINVGDVLQIPSANVVEKGAALLAAFVYLATRPVDTFIAACLGVFLCLIIAFGMLTTSPDFEWSLLINSLNQVIIFFALLAGVPDRRDKEVLLPFIAFVPILSVLLGFVYDAAGLKSMYSREFASGLERLGGSIIPAYLSGIAMCGTFAALQIALARRPVFLVLVAINFMILLMAGGRAALAVTLLICSFWILANRRIVLTSRLIFLFTGMIGAVGMLGLVWDRLMTRFTSSGLNGRDLLWEYLWSVSEQYPLIGIGFGHQFWIVPDKVSVLTGSKAAHNDYIRLIVEIGWVGATVFYVLLAAAIIRLMTRKAHRVDFTIGVGLVGFLLLSFSDNTLAGLPYLLLLYVSFLAGLKTQRRSDPVPAPSWAPPLGSRGLTIGGR